MSKVAELIKTLNAAYGKAVLGTAASMTTVKKIPLRNPAFDYISGGGIPVNRITELIGLESSTKTLHALWACAAFQKVDWDTQTEESITSVKYEKKELKNKDGSTTFFYEVKETSPKKAKVKQVAFIDLEGTFDRTWAEKQGIDLKGLIYFCPDSASQAVDVADALLRDSSISLVVIDSLSAVGSDAEVDASMENEQMAINARFWNKAVRKFQAAINANPDNDITLICINTLYNKVGMVFGNPETPKNGTGLKLAKSLSVRFTALKEIKKKVDGFERVIGRNYNLKCLKNKTSRPFMDSSFFLCNYTHEGLKEGSIDFNEAILSLATELGIINRAGAWYSYDKIKGQGFEGFRQKAEETGVFQEIVDQVYDSIVNGETT